MGYLYCCGVLSTVNASPHGVVVFDHTNCCFDVTKVANDVFTGAFVGDANHLIRGFMR